MWQVQQAFRGFVLSDLHCSPLFREETLVIQINSCMATWLLGLPHKKRLEPCFFLCLSSFCFFFAINCLWFCWWPPYASKGGMWPLNCTPLSQNFSSYFKHIWWKCFFFGDISIFTNWLIDSWLIDSSLRKSPVLYNNTKTWDNTLHTLAVDCCFSRHARLLMSVVCVL